MQDVLSKIGWIGVGGFLGANARYWLGLWISQRYGTAFPWSTFAINVTGAFVLGLLVALLAGRLLSPAAPTLRLAVATGFLGAYTTFSTFEYETLSLAQVGSIPRAFLNALGSLAAGFFAVWLGEILGRLLTKGVNP